MPQLLLSLLGPFAVRLDGQLVTTFESVKVRALLAFLAVEADHPHSRAALAELLWPELPHDIARTYLRHVIGNLREAIADSTAEPPYLLATRDTIQFNRASDHALDVATFTSLLAACDAHAHRHPETCRSCARRRVEALAFYRGDFLDQLLIRDSAEFEAWAILKRERLRQSFLDATTKLASYHVRRGDDAMAQPYLERQVDLDPWDEAARRQLMTLLWRRGRRSAALAQYGQLRRILAEDLEVEPEDATTALFAHIRETDERPAQDGDGTRTRPGLPAPTTPLIGREVEVAQLTELLQNPACRLVTLTGTGGIGKTRLALELASDLYDEFPDGIAFVRLAPVRDPAQVIPAVAKVLGVQEVSAQPLLERLKLQLRARQLLLILDNFEHVSPAAPSVAELLGAAPHLTVLVSSRAPLHLYGEHEFAVAPLALPDRHARSTATLGGFPAVALFVQRAQAARPTFQLVDANAHAVAEICRRLDGLPLAIELAAARSKLFAPEALLARLEPRLPLLSGGPRDAPARHQTMRGTIDWSYRLLEADEQRLFARLAVFVGGWTVEAATAVCNADGELAFDVLDGLQSLLDKSLLHVGAGPEGEPRFTMLEMIREYAREHLKDGGEVALLRRLHATYYLSLVEAAEPALRGPDQLAWLERLEAEQDNVRAALGWCRQEAEAELGLRLVGALSQFYFLRATYEEWGGWLTELLAVASGPGAGPAERGDAGAPAAWSGPAPSARDAAVAKALLGRALLLLGILKDPWTVAYSAAALSRCQASGDSWASAAWLLVLGVEDVFQGATERGRARLEASLELARQAGDPWLLAHVARQLGWQCHRFEPDGRRLYEESLALARQTGDAWSIQNTLMFLGFAAWARSDHRAATAHLEESLALNRRLGNKQGSAASLLGLVQVALAADDYERAGALNSERYDLERALGNKSGIASTLHMCGVLALLADDAPVAASSYEAAVAHWRELDDRPALAINQCHLAIALLDQGDHERAATLLTESLPISQVFGDREGIGASLAGCGGVASARDQPVTAARLMGAAAAVQEQIAVACEPVFRLQHDRAVASARAKLGQTAWEAAWAEGRALPPEQAIAEALSAVGDETAQAQAH